MKSGANYQDQNEIKNCMRKGMTVEETSKFLGIYAKCVQSFYDHFEEEIGEVAESSTDEEQYVSEEERSNFETEKADFGVEKANFEAQKSGFETEKADFEAKKASFETMQETANATYKAALEEVDAFEKERIEFAENVAKFDKELDQYVLKSDLSTEESEAGN